MQQIPTAQSPQLIPQMAKPLAPRGAESWTLSQGLARPGGSRIPNHGTGRMGWARDGQDFEKMKEFGAPQPLGHQPRLPAPPGHGSWGRLGRAHCPGCSSLQGALGDPQENCSQPGIYSSILLRASSFLPASSFPAARSTYQQK